MGVGGESAQKLRAVRGLPSAMVPESLTLSSPACWIRSSCWLSQGGTVQVWDTRSLDRPSGSFAAGSGASSGPPGGACWPVRCLRFDSGGNWLFAGAGSRLHPWSLAAGALGKGVVDTGASLPHALLVEPNRVLVAGDEPVLRRYDFSGRLVSRAATDAVCTFGLARCDETRVLAMAGCSGRLDVLADNGSKIGGLF